MREYLEILLYRYKKQNGLDVYSELTPNQLKDLNGQLSKELDRVNRIQEIKNIK